MFVEISLEPSSAEAERIQVEWQDAWQLESQGVRVEIPGAKALDTTFDLRSRCYDRGITVNLTFYDTP